MTEEEKKAYNFYKECNDNDLSAFEYFSEPSKKQIKYMEILLNLIQKQNNRLEQLEKENKELKKYKERCEGAVEFINSRIDGIVEDCYEDLYYILCESEEGEW